MAERERALDGFRGMAVAAMLATLAVPAYLIGTIIMPIAGCKEHFLDADEDKCKALQKLLMDLERLYEYALLAPAYSSLSASSMAQAAEVALLGNDTPTKLRCAYASMSDALIPNPDIINALIPNPNPNPNPNPTARYIFPNKLPAAAVSGRHNC